MSKEENIQTQYDYKLYQLTIPPDLKDSLMYQRSTAVGFVASKSQKCKSSFMYVDNKKIPICTKSHKLSVLGTGYPLFFQIAKKLMIVTLLLLPFAFFRGFINFRGGDCLNQEELSKLDDYVDGMDGSNVERESRLLEGEGNRDPWTSNAFSSKQNLNHFMWYFCTFKWYTSDAECKKYKNDGCYDNYSDECVDQSIAKFKIVYEHRVCYRNFINTVSEGNRAVLSNDEEKDQQTEESVRVMLKMVNIVLTVFSFIILFIFVLHMQFYHEKMVRIYDSKNLTVEDFSAKLIGLPHGKNLKGVTGMKDLVRDTIENSAMHNNKPLKVTQVNFVYDTSEYIKLRKQLQDVIVDEQKLLFQEEESQQDYERDMSQNYKMPLLAQSQLQDFVSEKNSILKRLAELEKKYDEGAAELLTGMAFVSFEDLHQVDLFKSQRFNYNIFRLCCRCGRSRNYKGPLKFEVKGKKFKSYAEEPEEPNDIIWENQSYSSFKLFLRWVAGIMLAILVLLMGFIIVLVLSLLFSQLTVMQQKRKDIDQMSLIWANLIDYGGALVIFLFDFVLEWAIEKIAKFRKPKTFTEEHMMIFRILWVLQFMTNAIIPVFYAATMVNFFGQGGLIEMINGIYISNLWLNPLIRLFIDTDQWGKYFARSRIENFSMTLKGQIYTQYEANEAFEKLQWKISSAHAFMIKTFALGLFFTPLFPLSVPYTVAIMFIYYWVEKWILLNRCNKIYRFSGAISQIVIRHIPDCMLIFSLGFILEENVINYVNLRGFRISIINLLLFVFSLFVYLFDFGFLIECFVKNYDEEGKDTKYDQMRFDVTSDYDLVNPATSGKTKEKQLGFMADYGKFGMLKERGKDVEGKEIELAEEIKQKEKED